MTTSNKVLSGPFIGKTKAELLTLLRAAQDELADGGATVTSASVNGQSFSKTQGPSVLSRIRLIQAALAQVDPDYLAPGHTINVRFGSQE
jgi:hypothetical protein